MRKIVLMMGMSLDGYIEGPDRDISWHRVDEELHTHMNATIGAMGGLLHGRVVYELMAAYWPTADADPDAPASVREFAPIWRDLPKVVYSRTLTKVDWNSTLVREVVPEEVRALKAQPGGDLALGGVELGTSFLRLGLVDELRIYVHPVLVGRGKPLFPPADTLTSLRLVESHTFGNGVVLLRYEVEPESGTAP
ncbi:MULTISPECIES: dihydrofolate reductase family protein [unclassified Streptomyces]|jgi:dihydrofolate reductase|uniref:dihydrofolate reductase family protein n=1 Tax=unclassified Streptomyces TaxID=2593676 RepID=UPI000F4D9BAE|nr:MULTISPECIES: dihydrofolate reductase family protein [unclassified Streptomyces]MDH6452599.1 dihydrofolate reductase [Streptomyces sp. SAI-119]MDH6496848.1 dihydrofolate reductase [Streptomyces sp. SAI-149]QUC56398.1 dihydrofolate reductase [Streptomyces sp. A2-16]